MGNASSVRATLSIQGGAVTSSSLILGNGNLTTGLVYQTAGTVNAGGVQVGSGYNGGGYGEYHLYGGTLNAGSILFLGTFGNTKGVFDMTNGQMTATTLMLGRINAASGRLNSKGYYYQSGGVAVVSNLYISGNDSSGTNLYGYFAVSNGTFTATNFSGLAFSPSSTGQVYLGQGSLVTLGAFPTTRGSNSYADITFDGGTLSPIGASGNYMSNLTHAFITTNGAIFNVASNKGITVAQALENAAGQAGTLTKQGVGALTLSGVNTYSGGTTISAGTLVADNNDALGTGLLTLGGGTLSNMSDRALANDINLSAASTIGVLSAKTLTLSGVITNTGALTKQGTGELILSGNNTYSNITYVSAGTLTMSGNKSGGGNIFVGNTASTPAVLNIQGGSVTGGAFQVGAHATGTGSVYQTAGTVGAASIQLGGLFGNAGGYGAYHLDGGTLQPNILYLGTFAKATGVFDMTAGQMAAASLEVGREFSHTLTAITNTSGYYYQSGGTATVAALGVGGATTTNTYGYLAVSNGTFTATNFQFLAGGLASTGQVYLGQGSLVTLGAFPTARGVGSYADLTFDGGTLSPIATSLNCMSNLTHAFITTNGAIFDVASGKDITVAQALEDAAGQAGRLTKQGVGVLTLSGVNTFSGGTTVNGGTLALTSSGQLSSMATVNSGAVVNNAGKLLGLVINAGGLATGGGQYGIVTNMAGGTLTPGVGGDTNYFGDLTLGGDSTNLFWLGSAATHDMSVVTNSLTYGGASPTDAPVLQLDLSSWSGSYGEQVVLYDNTFTGGAWDGTNQLFRLSDATGLFNGTLLTNGMVFTVSGSGAGTFKINYDLEGAGGPGNDILLTVIPEPASINLLAMLGAAYFMRRRIHRKRGRWNI